MNHKKWLGLAAGSALLLLLSMTAQAQKMYRCGSAYQDRPCEGAQPAKEVRNFDSAPKPVASASTDGQCRQRGIDSQKIVWSREAGALAEKLKLNASEDEKNLITDVYSKRGSAPEIRAAIEADCIAAKKQAEQAAAMIAAGLKLQGKDQTAPGGTSPQATTADTKATATVQGDESAARRVAENKKALCSNIAAKIDVIQKTQRSGGNVAAMESLNQNRRDAEAERSRAGC